MAKSKEIVIIVAMVILYCCINVVKGNHGCHEHDSLFFNNTAVNGPILCPIARDCKEWYDAGVNKSGIYPVNPDDGTPFQVYCDMETNGGGWTVFQRRQDGSVNFTRNWIDYERGFGYLNTEFWLGLSKIHRLTPNVANTLRIDLGDFSNNYTYAQYNKFQVLDSVAKYGLVIGTYNGTAGDSLTHHNMMKFSTKDKDNDAHPKANCALNLKSGWWYNKCHYSNLNGQYDKPGGLSASSININWYHWRGYSYSLRFTEMKVRHN